MERLNLLVSLTCACLKVSVRLRNRRHVMRPLPGERRLIACALALETRLSRASCRNFWRGDGRFGMQVKRNQPRISSVASEAVDVAVGSVTSV